MEHEKYMHRCLQLAQMGSANVAPNPMVGAVLVYNDTIIGEGYHAKFGHAHAEVNCINSVMHQNIDLISKSTLYVSLEPCAHYGKTPPCVNLIIEKKIPNVVIGCTDLFAKVNGAGIQKLKASGINVVVNVLQKECELLNKPFFTFHQKKRPYTILKWAQSSNKKIGKVGERIFISNELSNRLVHKWRSQCAAILVGANTVIVDNPFLTSRLWNGNNPTRIVIDKELRVSMSANVFNAQANTIVFNAIKTEISSNIHYHKLNNFSAENILHALYNLQIQSVLIEGGAKILQSFIDANLFDEIRIIENEKLIINDGIEAPIFNNVHLTNEQYLSTDKVCYYTNKESKV